jgi:transcriptional regulator with XRE-family HTH domain
MKKAYEFSEKNVGIRIQLMMEVLGNRIRKERMNINMSRTELAYYAGTTEGMICNMENGKKSGISIYTLVKISEALDISLCVLFDN